MGDFCTLWAFACQWFGMFLQMQFTTCNIYVVNKFLIACPSGLCQCIAASRTSLGPNLGKWGIAYAIWSSNLLAGKVEFNSTVGLLQATWQAWPLLRWYWSTVSYLCWCFSRANCRMDTEILYCTQGFVVLRLWVPEGCLWRKWKFCDDPVCSDVHSQWVMVNLHLFLGVAVMHCFSSALLFLWGLGAWCQVLADLACLQRKAFFWGWSSSGCSILNVEFLILNQFQCALPRQKGWHLQSCMCILVQGICLMLLPWCLTYFINISKPPSITKIVLFYVHSLNVGIISTTRVAQMFWLGCQEQLHPHW